MLEVPFTVYTLVIYCHLLGALALFAGYGIEWTASALFRKASSTEQVRAWLSVFRVSPPLSGAGLAILILSGGYLASLSGAMKQGWIPATLLAIGVVLILGFARFWATPFSLRRFGCAFSWPPELSISWPPKCPLPPRSPSSPWP